jgi:WbqC-like protein family
MKTICIMQPYAFPYVPYFQLAAAVDEFWIFDDVQYIRRGWMNRNYILVQGEKRRFTLPVTAGSRSDLIRDKALSADFPKSVKAFSELVRQAYLEAPHVADVRAIVDELLGRNQRSFLDFAMETLSLCFRHLDIGVPLRVTSDLKLGTELGADRYVNPIGGTSLYDPDAFVARGIDLQFLRGRCLPYSQLGRTRFEPGLSILDLIANVDYPSRKLHMQCYSLVAPSEARTFADEKPSGSEARK